MGALTAHPQQISAHSAASHIQVSTSVTVTAIFITSPSSSSSSSYSKQNTGNCQKRHHEHVFKTWHGTVSWPWASFQCTTFNCLSIRHKHQIHKLLLTHTCDRHLNCPLILLVKPVLCLADWWPGTTVFLWSMGILSQATESVILAQKWAKPQNLGSMVINFCSNFNSIWQTCLFLCYRKNSVSARVSNDNPQAASGRTINYSTNIIRLKGKQWICSLVRQIHSVT